MRGRYYARPDSSIGTGSHRSPAPGRHWTGALARACFSCPVTSA